MTLIVKMSILDIQHPHEEPMPEEKVRFSIAEFRNKMADALNIAGYAGAQVALTRRGKVVAYLVSPEDVEELRAFREDRVRPEVRSAYEQVAAQHEKLLERLAKQ